jgi:hypothetical protein
VAQAGRPKCAVRTGREFRGKDVGVRQRTEDFGAARSMLRIQHKTGWLLDKNLKKD